MLQKIPSPILLSNHKTLWRIDGQDFLFPTAQNEPDRWVYVPEKARQVVHFANKNIRHIKGDMLDKPYEFMPWILAYACELFGWVDKETGNRKYNESYAEVARKNSKTLTNVSFALASILILKPAGGAEAYFIASKEDQAKIAYEMAENQIKLCKREGDQGKLHEYLEAKPSLLRIDSKINNNFLVALSGASEGQTGTNPYFALVDEIHEIKNQKLLTAVRTGMVGRGECLFSMISTAGDDKQSAGYKERVYATKLINGDATNDRYLPLIFAAEDGDDYHSATTWAKANPGLGISVNLDNLRSIHDKAWAMHTGTAGEIAQGGGEDDVNWDEFLRYHLNIWTTKSSGYCSMMAWQDCRDLDILKNYIGKTAFSGLDLAESIDMNSFVLDFPTYRTVEEIDEETGETNLIVRMSLDVIPWYWVCDAAATASERTGFNYRNFVKHNLEITEGDTADMDYIQNRIVAITKLVKHVLGGYDPYNAAAVASYLIKKKIELVKVRQGFLTLNEPTKMWRDLVLKRELRHPDNEILNWNMRNAQVVYDTNKNMKVSKEHSKGKIDGLAAGINALRCIMDSPAPKESVYEKRGVRKL